MLNVTMVEEVKTNRTLKEVCDEIAECASGLSYTQQMRVIGLLNEIMAIEKQKEDRIVDELKKKADYYDDEYNSYKRNGVISERADAKSDAYGEAIEIVRGEII